MSEVDERAVESDSGRSPAVILHLAFAAGAMLGVVAIAVVGSLGIVTPIPDLPRTPMRAIGLVLMVGGFVATGALSGGVGPRRKDQSEMSWWRANSTRATATWALSEGLAIIGAVFWLLTRDIIVFVCLVGGGIGLLIFNRPGKMMEE